MIRATSGRCDGSGEGPGTRRGGRGCQGWGKSAAWRHSTPSALLLSAVLAVGATPAAAWSNAAEYLIREQIAEACEGGAGEIDPAAAVERDLTGNGRDDFILSHEGIKCASGRESGFCGQHCNVKIYVRQGELLQLERDLLGRGVSVGAGSMPVIQMYGLGGRPVALRWNGHEFAPAH